MNLKNVNREYATLIAPIECAARALKMIVHRDYHVVTPSIDAYVGLLIARQSQRIACVVGRSVHGVPWSIVKARAVKAEALLIIFADKHVALAAQEHADKLKASGKINGMTISCLTADAAVQQLKNSSELAFGSTIVPTESQGVVLEPENKSSPPTGRMNQHYRNSQDRGNEYCDWDKSRSRVRL